MFEKNQYASSIERRLVFRNASNRIVDDRLEWTNVAVCLDSILTFQYF